MYDNGTLRVDFGSGWIQYWQINNKKNKNKRCSTLPQKKIQKYEKRD